MNSSTDNIIIPKMGPKRKSLGDLKRVCKFVRETNGESLNKRKIIDDGTYKKKMRYGIYVCNECKSEFESNSANANIRTGKGICKTCQGIDGTKMIGHPLYQVWNGIKQRCYSKNRKDYNRYGGIGVTMCDEWKNDSKAFIDFCVNNGWKHGLVIDKDIKSEELGINPHIYSPETLSFITSKENKKQSMIDKNGKVIMFNIETLEKIKTFSTPLDASLDNITPKLLSLNDVISRRCKYTKYSQHVHGRATKLFVNETNVSFSYEKNYEKIKLSLANQK